MENNTQLPVEVVNAVHMEAEEIYNKLDELATDQDSYDFGLPMFNKVKEPIETALTAYATKLHQLDEHFKVMSISCNAQLEKIQQLQQENDKLKQQAEGWRPLLEEVLKHDAAFGKLPIKLIDKIKKFLYGE